MSRNRFRLAASPLMVAVALGLLGPAALEEEEENGKTASKSALQPIKITPKEELEQQQAEEELLALLRATS
jgi:hypothetical protein